MAAIIETKPESQDGPAKPSLEQILVLASELVENSPVAKIEKVLLEAAKAGLEPLAKDKVLSTIQKQAGSRIKPLRQQLNLIEQELGLHPGDPALDLARKVRADHFNGGAHLRRCADGSYWVYKEGTHWRETTNEALRRIILEEAGKNWPPGTALSTLVGQAKTLLDDLTRDPLPISNRRIVGKLSLLHGDRSHCSSLPRPGAHDDVEE